MNGDFSRWTAPNAAARRYVGVLMQQGRLHTDADWNESVELQLGRSEAALGDIIGRAGAPKSGGFAIAPGPGGFRIAAGRYYLDGAMVENQAAVSYAEQGGDVAVRPFSELAADGDDVIVYLEATRAMVSARQDARLADPALGGVDTATRIQAAWRVSAEPITLAEAEREALIDAARCGGVPDLPGWSPGTGRLRAGTVPAGTLPDDSDCLIPPEAGYLSQENQLYRVQILRGGTRAQSRFAWSRENASVEAVLARNTGGEFVLQGAIEDEALGFPSGGWVEVYDAADAFNGRSGRLTRLTLTDGVATFAPAITTFDALVRPRVRRWDQTAGTELGMQLLATPVDLERGIQVSFTDGAYREGDYWVFEARAATGDIVWPPSPMDDPTQPIPPMGWGFRRAALALARVSGGGLADVVDLRAEFPTLTCLHAEDVEFDDAVCQMGAGTVQEAIETLCQRTTSGLCTVVVRTAEELRDAVSRLEPGQSARLCLRAGVFGLDTALIFEGLGHVVVVGTGPQTVVSVVETEAALLFRGCASVRMADLSINGGPTGASGADRQDGRLGAISAVDCGDVSVERVRARCRAGLDRRAACVSTLNRSRTAQVRVRDCTLQVGQAQIGVQIVGARRALVENNLIVPVPAPGPLVARRILADPQLVAGIRRGLLAFGGGPSLPGSATITSGLGEGEERPLEGLFASRMRSVIEVPGGRGGVAADMNPQIERALIAALGQNPANRIPTEREMRQHLDNLVVEAIRNNGRAVVGRSTARILPTGFLRLADQSYIAQGVVVAGSDVDEVRVTGNRIERAGDGVRIAASSAADAVPPNWRGGRPGNAVRHARVEANVITTLPVANEARSHGVYVGHVDNASVGGNDISAAAPAELDPERPTPQFGVFQYGFRGPRLTVSENTVSALYHGYAVVPELFDEIGGVWRLRDNAAAGCMRNYVVVPGVQIL